jgi:ABC-type multidrug transport system ATPase subunit
MIKVVNLTQHYGVQPVLKNVDFEVREGELVAVMGPNGMGKSTLLAAIAGVLSPQKGRVEIDGIVRRSSEENELAIQRKVVYLPADAWLPKAATGREFLLASGRLWDVEEERLIDHSGRLLKLFDLEEKGGSPIFSYSTGQKKKIALSAALITDAPILLLDEPFAGGLDPSGIMAMRHVMKKLAEQSDRTIVIAVPVPELVEEIAGRIAIIRRGELIAYDTVDGLRKLAGDGKSLAEVLEHLINPQTMANLAEYFEGSKP